MIGYLKGMVLEKRGQEVWLDVSGVGYRVRVGERGREGLEKGNVASLFIHTAVRETEISLYGFLTLAELDLFEVILGVSGVGPKIGLAIVGTRSVERILKAVREADVAFFQSIPGIGKKGAQRIIVDLKGKLPQMKELDLSAEGDDEVVEALVGLGFKREDVMGVVGGLEGNLEERVREGLKKLGRK